MPASISTPATTLVERIKPAVKRSMRPEVLAGIGGFGALVEVPLDRYRRPVMVSGTDGVGTKLRLAIETGRHDTIGIDLVAMCANDVVVQGAEPLFFLDYYATGKLGVDTAERVIKGIVEGCLQAGCALVGGETAEMPGMYAGDDYDLAGFCVGLVEKDAIIDGSRTSRRRRDHRSRLARPAFERLFADPQAARGCVARLRRRMLDGGRCTTCCSRRRGSMCKSVLALLAQVPVHGIAHITGGGPTRQHSARAAGGPRGRDRRAHAGAASRCSTGCSAPATCRRDEMYRTFNCGLGMTICVPASARRHARSQSCERAGRGQRP